MKIEKDNETWLIRIPLAEAIDAELMRHIQFLLLAQKLQEETRFYSLKPQFQKLATYQSIVAMGRQVVPYILQELPEQGMLWSSLLQDITHENPVTPENRQNVEATKQTWLEWARKQAII